MLGYGRSFRASKLSTVVAYKEESFLSCIQLEEAGKPPFYLGLLKPKEKTAQAKLSGRKLKKMADLSKQFPALFISPDSFSLLTDGPDTRRKFIDWGAFHCQPGFAENWQNFVQILKQRNACLKLGDTQGLAAWDKEWLRLSHIMTNHRKDYLERLMPCFEQALNDLSSQEGLRVDYWQGWSELESLEDAGMRLRRQELKVGHSLAGPQRADLQISLYDYPASQLLSRGQQKMLVCALYLAQGLVLTQTLGKECTYLIDDLSSELDIEHRAKFIQYLHDMGVQSFITGVEDSLLLPLVADYPHEVFYVHEGTISQCAPELQPA